MSQPCRILIVDDEKNVLRMLNTVFSQEGNQVFCAVRMLWLFLNKKGLMSC